MMPDIRLEKAKKWLPGMGPGDYTVLLKDPHMMTQIWLLENQREDVRFCRNCEGVFYSPKRTSKSLPLQTCPCCKFPLVEVQVIIEEMKQSSELVEKERRGVRVL